MEVLLILAVVVGVAVGVGLTTWQLSSHDTGKCVWVVDTADDLSELERNLQSFLGRRLRSSSHSLGTAGNSTSGIRDRRSPGGAHLAGTKLV